MVVDLQAELNKLQSLNPGGTSTVNAGQADPFAELGNLQSLGSGGFPKPEELFSGGLFSDILDVIQIPQFATVGALDPRVTVQEAIRTRRTPGEALGLGGLSGFAVDVALDPLNLLGVGLLTKGGKVAQAGKVVGGIKGLSEAGRVTRAVDKIADLNKVLRAAEEVGDLSKISKISKEIKVLQSTVKLGDIAKDIAKGVPKPTLAGSVKAGEKTLIGLKIPGIEGAVSLLPKGLAEPIAEILTKGFQALKRVGVGDVTIGNIFSKVFGTLPSISKGARSIDEIEALLAKQIGVKDLFKKLSRIDRVADATALNKIQPFVESIQGALKRGLLDEDQVRALTRKLESFGTSRAAGIQLSGKAQEIFDAVSPLVRQSIAKAKSIGVDTLSEKILPNLPTKLGETLGFSAPGRIAGKEESLEKFASVFRLGDNVVKGSPAQAASVTTGQKFVKVGDRWFEEDIANQIKNLNKKEARLANEFNLLKKFERETAARGEELPQALKEKIAGRAAQASDIPNDLATLQSFGLERKGAGSVEANLAMGQKVFKEDAMESLFVKLGSLDKMTARKGLLSNMADKFGTPLINGKAPEGFRKLKGIKMLDDFAFPDDMAEGLETVYHKYTNLADIKGLLGAYDTALNFWKKTATFVNPAFHTRNFVSNVWQMHLAGVPPQAAFSGLADIFKAGRAQKSGRSIMKALGPKDGELYQEMVDEAIGGVGRFFGDMEKSLKKQNLAFEWGGAAGELVEDGAKFGMYKHLRNKGWSKTAAAEEVRKFLFDYGDLTDFERQVLKRVFPFYTWTRKNLPLQLSMLIQDPTKFSAIAKAKRATEDLVNGEPMDEKLLPEWMREGYTVFLGERPNGLQNWMKLEGIIPSVDVAKALRPQELPLEQLSPIIKTPLELFTNYDFFFEQQIKEFPGQTKNFFGQEIPAQLEKIAGTFRPASEFEKVFGLTSGTKGMPLSERIARYLFGSNVRGFDKQKQEDVIEWVKKKDIDKIEAEVRRQKKAGNKEQALKLEDIIKQIESGALETTL